jgi:type VI secretion system secreted protein Hcp
MTPRKLFVAGTVAVVLCLIGGANSAQAAVAAYLKIEGTKQGSFKGETAGMHAGSIPVVEFNYQPQSPRDAATGQASGKRMHETLRIMKEVDAASPQLMKAMTSNEVLKDVLIEFVHPGPGGKEEMYKTMHLMDAMISAVHRTGGTGAGKAGEREEITFTFQKIEMTSRDGKKMASDDWMAAK